MDGGRRISRWATAPSKKEAGQKAALMALSNKKLMKRLEEKKSAFKAAMEAQNGATELLEDK